jgi:hypothetical protein
MMHPHASKVGYCSASCADNDVVPAQTRTQCAFRRSSIMGQCPGEAAAVAAASSSWNISISEDGWTRPNWGGGWRRCTLQSSRWALAEPVRVSQDRCQRFARILRQHTGLDATLPQSRSGSSRVSMGKLEPTPVEKVDLEVYGVRPLASFPQNVAQSAVSACF